MALTCDPNELALAAKCFQCLDDKSQKAIELYLMSLIAGVTPDPEALQAAAKDFKGIGKGQWQAMIAYLTCLGAGGISYSQCLELSGAVSPVGSQTPQFVGQLYHDTTSDTYWRSTGLSNVDWTQIAGGGLVGDLIFTPANIASEIVLDFSNPLTNNIPLGDWSFPNLVSSGSGINIYGVGSLTSFSAPLLSSVVGSFSIEQCPLCANLDVTSLQSTTVDFSISYGNGIVSLSAPALSSIGGALGFSQNNSLTSANFAALVSVGGFFSAADCPLLATASFPLLATVGTEIDFSNDIALTVMQFPSLTSLTTNFKFVSCTNLVSLSIPVMVFPVAVYCDVSGCALNATSVEGILRRGVVSACNGADFELGGGTNAGLASLSVQGQADYATLALNNTVNINP